MFKNILFPTDGSRFSMEAACRVVELAKVAGARLTILHVMTDHPVCYTRNGHLFNSLPAGTFGKLKESKGQEILNSVAELCRQKGVECTEVAHIHDAIYKAIIDTAALHDCDLIFMAAHGFSGVGALLLGSETNKVLVHSKRPVLIYR